MMLKLRTNRGFTLTEVLVSAAILVVVSVGLIQVFLRASALSSLSGNMTIAMSEAQDKIEEIRNHDFDLIMADYVSGGTPGDIFSLSEVTGTGKIYISNANPDLLEIEVVVSWQEKDDRVIGEDQDLDGVLDAGEDINGNSQLDSTARIITYLARRM